MRCVWLLVVGCGCGRVGFDPGDALAIDAEPTCAGSTALLCDDFEAPSLSSLWIPDTFHGVIDVVDTTRHRGSRSAQLHLDAIASSATNVRATLETANDLGAIGTLYVRVWMYFASPIPTTPFLQIVNLSNAGGTGISSGADQTFLVGNDYTSGDYRRSTTAHLTLDRWTCLTMETASGTTATTRVFVDDAEIADVAIPKTTAQPVANTAYLGLEYVGTVASQIAATAWIDDVIIDDKPIGCAN